ncbi:MutH/Sau3AI family endonuclease [Candidatus Omnitrophota bacterium]
MNYDKKFLINTLGYDPAAESSILKRAKALVGLTVAEVIASSPLKDKPKGFKSKGAIGNIIEKHWFGIENNPSPEPDFVEVGIELKIVPLIDMSGGLTVKERTKICSINYFELIKEQWKTSHAKSKLSKILFIYYLYDGNDQGNSKVKLCDFWSLEGGDAVSPRIESAFWYI